MAYVNNTQLSLRDSFMANVTLPELRSEGVYMAAPKYNVISQLADKLGAGFSVSDRKFSASRIGNMGVVVQIASRTADGANLILTFSDTEFQKVRETDLVMSNGVQGLVISTAPGTITIAPWTDATGANINTFGSEFAALSYLSVLGDSSIDSGSRNKQSLTYSPETDYNYASVKRDAVSLTRQDLMQGTYEKYKNGTWAFFQEKAMRMRFSKQYENLLLLSNRNQKNGRTTTGGMIWAAKTYGTYYPQATETWTEAELQDFIDAIKTKTGSTVSKLTFLVGTKWMANFQRVVVSAQVAATGINNTLGGASVKGIDGHVYAYNGVDIEIVEYEAFNDANLFPELSTIGSGLKSQYSCLVLNTDPVETSQGMKPAFEKFYFDSKPVRYFYQAGIVGVNDLDPSKSLNMDYVLTSNDFDGFTAGILCDDGLFHWGAERHAYWEMSA